VTSRAGHHARLTPGRVRSVSFRLARLGRRGFDEDDVREFCDRVEGELSLLFEERTALQAEVRRLRGWAQAINQRRARLALPPGAMPVGAAPSGHGPLGHGPSAIAPSGAGPLGAGPLGAGPLGMRPSGTGPLGAPVSLSAPNPPYGRQVAPRSQPVDVNDQALRILAKAQQTAERYVSDAHAYSQEVAHEAQRRRDKILAEASTKATDMLEHAHQVAIRNNLTPDTDRGRQPVPRPAPTPAPPNYSDIAARYPTATRDYRALHSHDPRSARDSGPGYEPRPAYGSSTGYGLGPGYDSGPGSAHDSRVDYGASSGSVFDPRSAHDSGSGSGFTSAPVYDPGPSSAHNPRHTYGSGASYNSASADDSGPSSAHRPRHTYGSGTSSAHDPRSTYDSGPATDPRSVYNSPTNGSPTYESPTYNSSPGYDGGPAHNPGQPGPGADYSTVVGYPGPAADYRAPQVPPARPVPPAPQPDVPEPRRDDEGYSDGYGDPRFGDSRFPF
jgi:DivIVA domain-containing protein